MSVFDTIFPKDVEGDLVVERKLSRALTLVERDRQAIAAAEQHLALIAGDDDVDVVEHDEAAQKLCDACADMDAHATWVQDAANGAWAARSGFTEAFKAAALAAGVRPWGSDDSPEARRWGSEYAHRKSKYDEFRRKEQHLLGMFAPARVRLQEAQKIARQAYDALVAARQQGA